jgi:hypothetical protein
MSKLSAVCNCRYKIQPSFKLGFILCQKFETFDSVCNKNIFNPETFHDMKHKIILIFTFFSITFQAAAQDPLWVRDNTWFFDNFTQPVLGWDLFRETFIGVAPEPSGDFDLLLYDNIYKTKLAAEGHCFGMCLMAMVMKKNGGHLGYCCPPYIYSGDMVNGPADTTLRKAIQIMHGHQITHRFLLFLLDVIAINKNRDGNYAYQQYRYYTAKDDPCVISVTPSFSPSDGGHVLIPFFEENLGATKKIYIYDPNRSYYEAGADGHDYYHNRLNFVEINSGTGKWTFTMADGDVWTGDPGSGGNLLVIPISVAGKKDRLPQSLFAEGAYALNTVFIFGKTTQLKQISDPETGKNWLNEQSNDLETAPEKRMTNVVPFTPLTGGQPDTTANQAYFIGNDPSFEITVQSTTEEGYRVGFMGKHAYIEISAMGKGAETLHVEGLDTPNPTCTWISKSKQNLREHQLIIKKREANNIP